MDKQRNSALPFSQKKDIQYSQVENSQGTTRIENSSNQNHLEFSELTSVGKIKARNFISASPSVPEMIINYNESTNEYQDGQLTKNNSQAFFRNNMMIAPASIISRQISNEKFQDLSSATPLKGEHVSKLSAYSLAKVILPPSVKFGQRSNSVAISPQRTRFHQKDQEFVPYMSERDTMGKIIQENEYQEQSNHFNRIKHLRQILSYKDLKLQKHINRRLSSSRNKKDITNDLALWMSSGQNDLNLSMMIKQTQKLNVNDKNLQHRFNIGQYSKTVSAVKTVIGVNQLFDKKFQNFTIPQIKEEVQGSQGTKTTRFEETNDEIQELDQVEEIRQKKIQREKRKSEILQKQVQMKLDMADYLNRIIKQQSNTENKNSPALHLSLPKIPHREDRSTDQPALELRGIKNRLYNISPEKPAELIKSSRALVSELQDKPLQKQNYPRQNEGYSIPRGKRMIPAANPMIFSEKAHFDVSSPQGFSYFEPTKRKFGSFVTFERQVDRDLKAFNKEGFLDNLAKAKQDKALKDAQKMLGKKGPKETQVVNPFFELEKSKFRPKKDSVKPENPEITEYYNEQNKETGLQQVFERLNEEKLKELGLFNQEIQNQQAQRLKMLQNRNYYQIVGEDDLDRNKKLIKDVNKVKHQLKEINAKIEEQFIVQE